MRRSGDSIDSYVFLQWFIDKEYVADSFEQPEQYFIYIISWSNSNWYRDVTEDDIMSTKRFKYDKNVFWLDEWKSSLMNGYNLPRYWNDCINFFGLRNLRVFPPLGSWSTNKIVKSVGCLLNMVSPVETLPIHRASLNGTCHPDHPTMEWVLDE